MDLPFESFQEEADHVIAYIQCDETLLASVDSDLDDLKSICPLEYSRSAVPDENWNKVWESNFEPVVVDDICCIKADFHDINPKTRYAITINPKMAFGTGHHETTYMMIAAMNKLDLAGKSVFDFGCGTGILAILAEQMGAKSIYGVDYDQVAVDNAIENKNSNGMQRCQFQLNDSVSIPENKYDIILANINRKVLLDNAEILSLVLDQKGCLLLSGILKEDEELVTARYEANGFKTKNILRRGEWLCIQMGF